MGLKRTSHSISDTSYYLIWFPKYRKDIFEREEIKERTEQLIREICEYYGFESIELEVGLEHMHILISFPPTRSIGEVVRTIKSHSGRGLVREFPGMKKRLWARELWEVRYFARTVGDRMTQQVIERYTKHHRHLEQGPA